MQNTDIKDEYPDLQSYFNINYDFQENYEQLQQPRTETKSNLAKKEFSQLSASIFIITIITIYGLGIHQLSKTVIDLVDTVVEEVNRDYRFRIF